MLNWLYLLTLIVPFPFWFLMIVLPRTTLTRRIINSYTIFIAVGTYYVFMLVSTVITLSGSTGLDLTSFTTVEGLAKLMGTPIGALIVWSHMVIMDLIGGHWMYHEAERLEAPLWWSSLCLFMTLLSGPVGLLLFVSWRTYAVSRGHIQSVTV
jgi:hypothetical protein